MSIERDLALEELDQDIAPESNHGFFGAAQDILARHTHCPACKANLHFTHVTDFALNTTQETARCPECQLKLVATTHRLQ